MFYFGCESEKRLGHYLFKCYNGQLYSHNIPAEMWRLPGKIDAKLCPDNNEVQGEARITFLDGFTILAFWDRSADGRGKSNSAFIKKGQHNFDSMLAEAKETFPTIFARFDFEVTEYK